MFYSTIWGSFAALYLASAIFFAFNSCSRFAFISSFSGWAGLQSSSRFGLRFLFLGAISTCDFWDLVVSVLLEGASSSEDSLYELLLSVSLKATFALIDVYF